MVLIKHRMSDNSDEDSESKRKKFGCRKKRQLTRHHSLDLKYSKSKIGEIIIGAQTKKGPEKTADKQIADKEIIPGRIEMLGNESSNVKTSVNAIYMHDDVFKPKKSMQRSPVKINANDKNDFEETTKFSESQTTNKRYRSMETSPEIERHNKKQREPDRTSPTMNKNEDDFEYSKSNGYQVGSSLRPGAGHPNNTEEHQELDITKIQNRLDTIHEISTRENSGLSEDQKITLREIERDLYKMLMPLIFKMGKLENENTLLKVQIKEITSRNNYILEKQESPQTSNEGVRTYAKVVNQNSDVHQQITPEVPKEGSPWSTPPIKRTHETIVRVSNAMNSKEAMEKFKQELNLKDVGGAFKNIRKTQSGALIIQSHNSEQQEKLENIAQGSSNFTTKEINNKNPMFMITGVEKGYSTEEFLQEIESLNYEIVTELGYSVKDKIKVVTKRQCRNPYKENWILEARPEISKWFLKKGMINCDLVRVYVQEHLNMAVCFKCCGFGHVSKYCSAKNCCHKCGEEHEMKNCNSDIFNCPNCTKMQLAERSHSARDIDCPVYQRKLLRYRNTINYEPLN